LVDYAAREEQNKKRIDVLKKVASTVETAETERIRLLQKEEDYVKTTDQLRKELELLEADNSSLRRELRRFEQKDSLSNKRTTITSITEAIRSTTSHSSPAKSFTSKHQVVHEHQSELIRLRGSLEYLFLENQRLKLIYSRLNLDPLVDVLNLPSPTSSRSVDIGNLCMRGLLFSLNIPKLVSLQRASNVKLQLDELIDMRLSSFYTLGVLTTIRTALSRELSPVSQYVTVEPLDVAFDRDLC
jgi:hypothetical protein